MGKHILLIEDDRLLGLFIANIARSRGHTVSLEPSGCRVLYRLKQRPCDVVVTDVQMPLIDGLRVVELVRGPRSPCPCLPIIAMSADWSQRDQLLSLGANAFMNKPFNIDDLLALVEAQPPFPGYAAPDPARCFRCRACSDGCDKTAGG